MSITRTVEPLEWYPDVSTDDLVYEAVKKLGVAHAGMVADKTNLRRQSVAVVLVELAATGRLERGFSRVNQRRCVVYRIPVKGKRK